MIPDLGKSRAVLLDVEGTTTPIDFVKGTLFEYARNNIEKFLEANSENIIVKKYGEEICKIVGYSDVKGSFLMLMDRDSKAEPLKKLQGLIWKSGYEKEELKGNVYEDVPNAMKRWKIAGRSIFIYSSGSVLSQKMLFSSTQFGDLTTYIDGYFDTTVGGKKESESYEEISGRIGLDGKNIAFFTDSNEEISASIEAGFNSFLVCREGKCGGTDFISNFNGF